VAEVEIPDWSKEQPSDDRLSKDVLKEIDRLRVDAPEPPEYDPPDRPEEEAEAI